MTRSTLQNLRDSEQQTAVGREIINLFLNEGNGQNPFQNEQRRRSSAIDRDRAINARNLGCED